ncbi:exendin-3-like [Paroedura picta]|uniref:exendin-3-like n=1 Tax=Paroedura picta TaxID=143630 RepID=UPI00405621BA
MNKIIWLCLLELVIATLLPVIQQAAGQAGLESDVFKNVHDLKTRTKRHSDGTYTSDLSKSLDQDLVMEFLQHAIEGKLSNRQNEH